MFKKILLLQLIICASMSGIDKKNEFYDEVQETIAKQSVKDSRFRIFDQDNIVTLLEKYKQNPFGVGISLGAVNGILPKLGMTDVVMLSEGKARLKNN